MKMTLQDFLKLFEATPAPRPAHPDELTAATAKGHIHKVNPVWLPPPQHTNTWKKRNAKWNALKRRLSA